MSRLPQPGETNWGSVLNEFLLVAHREDGELRNTRLVVNARDHGAKGDGAADDTKALQHAIDAASGGGTLFVPAGVYTTRKLILPSDITICGEAHGTILKLHNGTLDALFTNKDWTNGNHHITLRDLHLEGNREQNDQMRQNFFPGGSADQDKSHGVNFHYVLDSLLENLTVNDFYYDGVYLGSSVPNRSPEGQVDLSNGSNRNIVRHSRIAANGRHGITITRGSDNSILGNFLQDNNISVDAANPGTFEGGAITIEPHGDWYDVGRNIVQGNHLLNNHYNGIQVFKNWTSTGILLSGNIISGTTRHGIAAAQISGLVVMGNHVSSSGAQGLAMGSGTGIKDSVISGNIVVGNGAGILINGAEGERIIVIANVALRNGMSDQSSTGIAWVDAKQVTLIGNISLDNGSTPRAQITANGADPIYAVNRVGPLGVPATSRTIRDTDFFAKYWRMYGSDTGIYAENQRNGKIYSVAISQLS